MYDILIRLGFSSETLNEWALSLSGGTSRDFETYVSHMWRILSRGTIDTLFMVGLASLFAIIFGTVIGLFLYLTSSSGNPLLSAINRIVGAIVNIGRSIPFVILIIILMPLARQIVGMAIGREASVVPLTIAAIPFMSRVMESVFHELGKGIIEAATSAGATTSQIVGRVILPESAPGMVAGFTLLIINLITFSAMAGVVGGGGLGQVAIVYGMHRHRTDVLVYTIIILVIIVQLVQAIGQFVSRKLDKR